MKLFVYGELCKPGVLVEVIGRVPLAEPAVLRGYRRALDGRTGYYRATARTDGRIVGLLLDGIESADLEALDDYEDVAGGEYEREEVEVELPAAALRVTAWIYAGGRGAGGSPPDRASGAR